MNTKLNYAFVFKTLLHLGFQLLLTGVTMNRVNASLNETTMNKFNKWILWFLLANIGLIFLIPMQSYIPIFVRFFLFCVFSFLNGIFISYIFRKRNVSSETVKKGVFETLAIFALMMFVGAVLLQAGIPIEPVLYLTLMFSITMFFVLIYILFFKVDNETRRIIRLLMILLMMLYIMINTYFNLDNRFKNDLVTSTFEYYTNVISIFRNLVLSED